MDDQALDQVVKLRLSVRQLRRLDVLVERFSMSRSWLLREAIAVGLPAAANRIEQLLAAGYRPAGDRLRPTKSGRRRGPQSDSSLALRWTLAPDSPGLRRPGPAPDFEDE